MGKSFKSSKPACVCALGLALAFAAPQNAGANGLFGDMVNGPYNWSGLYIGGQGGYAWGDSEYVVFGIPISELDPEGFLGGGHIGYNIQVQDIVFGIVGDVNFGEVDDGLAGSFSMDHDFTGSIRAKLGLALDRILLYVTGGVAFAEIDHTASGLSSPVSFSRTYVGLTMGGGAELAITDWISGFVEYRYTQYGDEGYGPAPCGPACAYFAHSLSAENHQVQGGISFRLGNWLAGPS